MTVLITGNMGYVGPWVVRRLRQSYPAARLLGLDMGYFSHCLTGTVWLPERMLDAQHFGDVRRPLPAHLLEGLDAVVYLAAISNDPMGTRFEAVTDQVNHRAAVALARQAKAAGARAFVFASSCSVYGLGDDRPRTEESELGPLTAYARSKVAAERDLAVLADASFAVTCLRFATACGMSDRLRLDLVLNDFVAHAVAVRRIVILSDGSPWRPLIHVSDMARAVDWAVARRPSEPSPFLVVNVGSDDWNVQVRDLAEAVARALPGVAISFGEHAQPDKRSYRVSFERFRRLAPDHQPRMTLPGAIAELSEGLRRLGFEDQAFPRSGLVRLEVLESLLHGGLLNADLEWTVELPDRHAPVHPAPGAAAEAARTV
ncbi:NAD-dependent epimerase/dehydratase family protein [Candidatus Nitrospira bockiana]